MRLCGWLGVRQEAGVGRAAEQARTCRSSRSFFEKPTPPPPPPPGPGRPANKRQRRRENALHRLRMVQRLPARRHSPVPGIFPEVGATQLPSVAASIDPASASTTAAPERVKTKTGKVDWSNGDALKRLTKATPASLGQSALTPSWISSFRVGADFGVLTPKPFWVDYFSLWSA